MKAHRQTAILDIVDGEPITSQEQLRNRLKLRGIEATQATLSRDIRDLGLVKRAADGAYVRPGVVGRSRCPTKSWNRPVADYLRRHERVEQMLVLKTEPGQRAAAGDRDRPGADPASRRHDRRGRHHPGDLQERRGGASAPGTGWIA